MRQGDLIRVFRGMYVDRSQWGKLAPWERYRVRVLAAARMHPTAVFSHESAASLLGMPVIGDPGIIHVLVPPDAAAREAGGIRAHRSIEAAELAQVDAISVTTPGMTAVTLARHRHHAVGLAAADSALRLDRNLTRAELVAQNEGHPSSRGRNHARWVIERATALHESVLESISDAAIEWLGLPAPELQREFIADDGRVDRGDTWWPHVGLVGEADGEFKYDGRFGDPAMLLRERQERDRRLRRGEVREIAHWGWTDLARVWPLRDLLTSHGLQQVRGEAHAELHALSRLLAPYERVLRTASRERTTRGRENG